jgi:hypothetical protein
MINPPEIFSHGRVAEGREIHAVEVLLVPEVHLQEKDPITINKLINLCVFFSLSLWTQISWTLMPKSQRKTYSPSLKFKSPDKKYEHLTLSLPPYIF